MFGGLCSWGGTLFSSELSPAMLSTYHPDLACPLPYVPDSCDTCMTQVQHACYFSRPPPRFVTRSSRVGARPLSVRVVARERGRSPQRVSDAPLFWISARWVQGSPADPVGRWEPTRLPCFMPKLAILNGYIIR